MAKSSFLEHGYAATSMSAIAADCGGSKTTLWSHFPSKEALFSAFVDRMVGTFGEAMDQALLDDGGTAGALRRFGRVFLTKIMSEDSRALKRMLASEGHRFPELLQTFYESGPKSVRQRLSRYMASQMAAGRIRDADPELAARQFVALCQGGCFSDTIWHRPGGPSSTPEQDIEAAIDTFLRAWGTPQ